jgi:predicted protein tyrosine phosphatase
MVQEIIPGHYLGELRAVATDAVRKMLTEEPRMVRHIVRCIPPSHFKSDHEKAVAYCEEGQLNLTIIEAEDDIESPISGYFSAAHGAISEALDKNEAVFVHCQAGVSRSSTIVISYLMAKKNMSLDEAFSLVKRKRPVICPNELFVQELMELDAAIGWKTNHEYVSSFDVDLHNNYQWQFRNLDNCDLRQAKLEFLESRGISPMLHISSAPELQTEFSVLLMQLDKVKKKAREAEELAALQ